MTELEEYYQQTFQITKHPENLRRDNSVASKDYYFTHMPGQRAMLQAASSKQQAARNTNRYCINF